MQEVLKRPGGRMTDAVIGALRECVEDTKPYICKVNVPDMVPNKQLFDQLGTFVLHTAALNSMPRVGTGSRELEFFNVGRELTADEVVIEYMERGLTMAYPFAVIAQNLEHPDFARRRPNATFWKDDDGRWCCFWIRRRGLSCGAVAVHDHKLPEVFWYAGVRY
ncbi:MAG TPA: hypothetical protein VGB97_02910 [Candidatus Paceibacterota bacterium]